MTPLERALEESREEADKGCEESFDTPLQMALKESRERSNRIERKRTMDSMKPVKRRISDRFEDAEKLQRLEQRMINKEPEKDNQPHNRMARRFVINGTRHVVVESFLGTKYVKIRDLFSDKGKGLSNDTL